MIYWIAPAVLLAPYVLGALDYLRKQALALVPPPSAVGAPFVPPFTGGQCENSGYTILLKIVSNDGTIGYMAQGFNGDGRNGNRAGIINFGASQPALIGKFRGIDVQPDGQGRWTIDLLGTNQLRIGLDNYSVLKSNITIDAVIPRGFTDNCGDLPNPNPSPSISDDGIADSPSPNLDSAPIVIEAAPLIILPSFAAALAAALAAARNALDALDAIKAVARALEALSDLLNKKNDDENEKEKEKKDKQDTIRYEFGSIQRDGFLRLYPQSNLLKYKAQQLDISFATIPSYLGKYFGKFSPNYYRYKPTSNLISSLGYISFVSPTFGVLSTHHLEFRRTSIKVPENSIGFYYHLGLDGALTANAFAFYTKPKP